MQVVRSRGALETGKVASAPLSLDLLHPEVELLGREIKNHLDAAGIRERNAVVAVPASWIMSQHTKLPELSPEDVDSFLHLEAEKGFPCDVAQLQIARSFQRSAAGTYVTQLAVRKERLDHLIAAVKAAGLKPVSFSLGLAALPDVMAPAGQGRITVSVAPKGAVLLVSAGGGIAAFRTFEATIESEAGKISSTAPRWPVSCVSRSNNCLPICGAISSAFWSAAIRRWWANWRKGWANGRPRRA